MIQVILWFFSGIGFLGGYVLRLGKAFFVSGAILSLQFVVIGALVLVRIAYLTTLVTIVLWIYNQMVSVFELINSTYTDTFLYLPISIMDSIGLIDALIFVFSSFTYIIISLLVLFISKFILNSVQSIADEYFKISVLIQLGVK
ncbi:hypothetical protein KO488_08315 [Poseidonibacter lekithochrous]|uniref:hypothetical protein n=1 Tax=Poseidonibacter TaxID=2321187 RepID=UPI001C0A20A1|nr:MULTISPECIES: hypothetical protein [Poseidonibacter]MBU3014758.1 hypothetical protein [Poseidonibacter lekithochrous]MDO6828056.1 hypothetical protein [Poseidonibacter sp. 1_MG-2023]